MKHHKLQGDIQLGIIGVGSMGKGLLYQSQITPGVRCAAVCDTRVERCTDALKAFGVPYQIADNRDAMEDAARSGKVAVCQESCWMAECSALDVIIEASSAIGSAIKHSIMALEQGKHLVLMNSEIDLMFGPLLQRTAKRHDVICTSCDGDQYGVLKRMIDDLKSWGFELVMAGNIKGFLDRYANPTSIVPEADKRNLDYRMCTSYTDGTKLSIEMAILANAFNLRTSQPGMVGPRVEHVQQVFECFDFETLWKDRQPFVDYILGAEPSGGVFAVGFCDNPYQRDMLSYYKMGSGPYYLFYRPYHLCHIEAMESVFMAARSRQCFLAPEYGFRANVYAYAKRDLAMGERLDGIGGYCCYGMVENVDDNRVSPGLPIALTANVPLNQAVRKDERITMADIPRGFARPDFRLYADAMKLSLDRGKNAIVHP